MPFSKCDERGLIALYLHFSRMDFENFEDEKMFGKGRMFVRNGIVAWTYACPP